MKTVLGILMVFLFVGCQSTYYKQAEEKKFSHELNLHYQVDSVHEQLRTLASDFLQKNEVGNWELKISGDPIALGQKNGLLTQHLYQKQQKIFFEELEQRIPSFLKRIFLLQFIKWYHKDMQDYIPLEYRKEIFALSAQATSKGPNLGSPYQRDLMLHGAHDLGHAMQNLMLVGCSSFGVWNEKTTTGELLIGRNFDFYINDAFAEQKLIQFVTPTQGIPFASVSWPGMVGVVSGMNLKGLTVTMNAGATVLSLKAKTPVSLVAREILQYAENIEQAIKIAQSKEVFVAEALLIGSEVDNRAVILELAPDHFEVYEANQDQQIIGTNHFQCDAYLSELPTSTLSLEEHTAYRFKKIEQELQATAVQTPQTIVELLRSTQGIDATSLGWGNEKAINQLLAHHAVIFQPREKIMWVSSSPYNLGVYYGYRLNEVFEKQGPGPLHDLSLSLAEDPFVHAAAFKTFEAYKAIEQRVREGQKGVSVATLEEMIAYNPDYWKAYFTAGVFSYNKGYIVLAKKYFQAALTKEIASSAEKKIIQKYLNQCQLHFR